MNVEELWVDGTLLNRNSIGHFFFFGGKMKFLFLIFLPKNIFFSSNFAGVALLM